MTKVYISKEDFSLNNNPQILERIRQEAIDHFDYTGIIQPKLDLIAGTYQVQNSKKDFSHLMPHRYVISGVNFSDVLKFNAKEKEILDIQIQDNRSYFIENHPMMSKLVELVSTNGYKKRTGLITIDRSVCANSIVRCTLDDVVKKLELVVSK